MRANPDYARFRPGESTLRYLVCLLLAAAMWLFLAMNRQYDSHVRAGLEIQLPDDVWVSDSIAEHLELKVHATGWQLLRMAVNPPALMISESSITGRSVLDMKSESSVIIPQLPDQVELLDVYPAFVPLHTVSKESKRVPLKLETESAPGWAIDSLVIRPDSVTLTGPSSRLSEIDHWSTELVVLPADSGWVLGKAALLPPGELEASAIVVNYHVLVHQGSDNSTEEP
ncbi:MAG TPA: YbbR-like domain-containing protein [Chitinophagales bacterium]|nr:YbbR-like domain-containing protein [Chitinophagales bacterium]HPE96390.1 YbbR-like domain-containing protein [Chitinophagales bacterium]HQU75316.1 YbbR-like domain-containing protein [Chitinophagales bacterium]HRX22567.1 YbbR-like domain-containing protein [Chitinophagales bacterium]